MHKNYFTYKSLNDIQLTSISLGVDVTFEEKLEAVYSPVRIGDRTIGNSLAVQPMEGCDGTLDGRPDELTFRRWKRFGAGGAKLLWGEAAAVIEEGRANSRQLLVSDATAPDLERMLRECRVA